MASPGPVRGQSGASPGPVLCQQSRASPDDELEPIRCCRPSERNPCSRRSYAGPLIDIDGAPYPAKALAHAGDRQVTPVIAAEEFGHATAKRGAKCSAPPPLCDCEDDVPADVTHHGDTGRCRMREVGKPLLDEAKCG